MQLHPCTSHWEVGREYPRSCRREILTVGQSASPEFTEKRPLTVHRGRHLVQFSNPDSRLVRQTRQTIARTLHQSRPSSTSARMALPRQEDKSEDGGLISVDRNSKATLPLTIPRPLQVVYKGSGAGKRRLGFNAGNTAKLRSTVRAGRTRLGTGARGLLISATASLPGR